MKPIILSNQLDNDLTTLPVIVSKQYSVISQKRPYLSYPKIPQRVQFTKEAFSDISTT
jgi:hypothetical protein